ncbi:PAS domain-containing protein [Oscillatoria sp. FACHB-1407]|uniref:CHASE4 domain-containing protein n=1 Tax=Oscillatoria sp. FACHB-1407 TaxID=2692847 RepID=UPI0016857BA5|nr:CHASE4 domain-containing protein [Oscillatoria sp. FACHB-1407]MBD2461652.1 PAS domain-containing protein [Oscillatoria sp. FACHB-1407]
MTLRQKIVLIIGLTLVCLIAVLYTLLSNVLSSRFAELERQDVQQKMVQVQNALSDDLTKLRFTARDWAEWDDTYAFIQDVNSTYARTNLNTATIARLDLNLMIYARPDGEIVFGRAYDAEQQRDRPIPESLMPHLRSDRPLLQHRKPTSSLAGIMLLPEGILMVASHPILPGSGAGPGRGSLIFGRYLSEAIVETLAEKTGLSTTVYRFDDAQLPRAFQQIQAQLLTPDAIWVEPLSSQAIAGYALVNDIYGNPALILRIDVPRRIYQEGQLTKNYLVFFLVIVGTVLSGVTLLFLEKLVLTRLLQISSEVRAIGISGDSSMQVTVTGRDELSQLAHQLNRMLSALNDSQHKRRESEARNRALLDAIPDLILRLGADGTYLDCKAPKDCALDFFAGRMLGETVHAFLPAHTAQQAMNYIHQALQTGEMQVYEYQLLDEGGVRDYEARIVVSGDQEVLTIVRDITDRKRIERLKNEFVSVVSHELRTPLTAIRGSLGLMLGGVTGELSEEARSLLEIACRNSDRLILLINDILDIEKIESGAIDFKLEPIELVPLVEQVIEANRAYGDQLAVQFQLRETVPGVCVKADGDRLAQVLTNLLSNAAKFSPPNSTVDIAIHRYPGTIRVAVTDYGCGIPFEFHSRIFQKFAQADASDSRQKGGTGLGLSISKAIIEKLGGQIGFQTKLGVGTTFYFDLPERGD